MRCSGRRLPLTGRAAATAHPRVEARSGGFTTQTLTRLLSGHLEGAVRPDDHRSRHNLRHSLFSVRRTPLATFHRSASFLRNWRCLSATLGPPGLDSLSVALSVYRGSRCSYPQRRPTLRIGLGAYLLYCTSTLRSSARTRLALTPPTLQALTPSEKWLWRCLPESATVCSLSGRSGAVCHALPEAV